ERRATAARHRRDGRARGHAAGGRSMSVNDTAIDAPLELRGITKSFGAVTAIHNFDLQVEPGEIVALVGDNGAGKSTLMKIIAGVYQPSGGEILLRGQKVSLADASAAQAQGIE